MKCWAHVFVSHVTDSGISAFQITSLVVPGHASYVTKSEFNAALALLALSQKNVGKCSIC